MEDQTAVFKDAQTQAMLNQPLANSKAPNADDEQFLSLILGLVAEGKIELYKSSSLINSEVYEALEQEKKAKVELEAMSMLANIRELKGLCDAGYRETFQVENLVHALRVGKERLEAEGGDIFII